MNSFEYYWSDTLCSLMTELSEITESFLNYDYQYEIALDMVLAKLCSILKNKNDASGLNQIMLLRAEWQNVKAGLDPSKLEKVLRGRSELKKIYFLKISHEVNRKLSKELEYSGSKITLSKSLIEQMISGILASKTIDIESLISMDDTALENLWKSINGSPELMAMKYKVQLSVNIADILIIIKKIRDNLSS